MNKELITLPEIRQIAQNNGWKVYVDTDGWYCFYNPVRFRVKAFYIHSTTQNILDRFIRMRDDLRTHFNFLTQDEDMGAFEDLIRKMFDRINQKVDLVEW